MASNRTRSKDIVERSNGDVVEQGSMILLMYTDMYLFIEKDIKITQKEIFEENLEDQ